MQGIFQNDLAVIYWVSVMYGFIHYHRNVAKTPTLWGWKMRSGVVEGGGGNITYH